MKKLVAQIKEELEAFVVNADAQVEKGNKAAGARARKAALDLMKDLKEFRKVSVTAPACDKQIYGHGLNGYLEAMDFIRAEKNS